LLKIKLYCVLSSRSGLSFEEQAEQCCQGGAEAVLLGGNLVSPKETVARGLKIRDICSKYKTLFFIGSRPDIALAVNADGLHLEPDDVSIDLAKQILGPRKLVGVFASSLARLVEADGQGADYVMVGPLFEAAKGEKSPLGLDIIRLVKKRVKASVIAAGAITLENLKEALAEGPDGVAVSRGICGAASPKEAAQKFLTVITGAGQNNKPAENR
jgi:thiamine-phosphate pyrophosphorylase